MFFHHLLAETSTQDMVF